MVLMNRFYSLVFDSKKVLYRFIHWITTQFMSILMMEK